MNLSAFNPSNIFQKPDFSSFSSFLKTGTTPGVALNFLNNLTGSNDAQKYQDMAFAFNMNEAQKNRDFQERMSNTSYQRLIEDLNASGLNPNLLINHISSGASTPSGAVASSPSYSYSGREDSRNLLNLIMGIFYLSKGFPGLFASLNQLNSPYNSGSYASGSWDEL